jgi:hypothetical protein
MAYTHKLVSPQDFSHRVFGGVLQDNIQDDWRIITSRSQEAIDQGGVLWNID